MCSLTRWPESGNESRIWYFHLFLYFRLDGIFNSHLCTDTQVACQISKDDISWSAFNHSPIYVTKIIYTYVQRLHGPFLHKWFLWPGSSEKPASKKSSSSHVKAKRELRSENGGSFILFIFFHGGKVPAPPRMDDAQEVRKKEQIRTVDFQETRKWIVAEEGMIGWECHLNVTNRILFSSFIYFVSISVSRSSAVAKRPQIVWFRVDEIFQLRSNKKNTKVKGKGRLVRAHTPPIQLTA